MVKHDVFIRARFIDHLDAEKKKLAYFYINQYVENKKLKLTLTLKPYNCILVKAEYTIFNFP